MDAVSDEPLPCATPFMVTNCQLTVRCDTCGSAQEGIKRTDVLIVLCTQCDNVDPHADAG